MENALYKYLFIIIFIIIIIIIIISLKDIDQSWHYNLLKIKCLMTNHATFDNQYQHASASIVHT